MKGKKGLSPLIATVILIAFAVALGAVVMTMGATFVKTVTPKVPIETCAGVSFGLMKEITATGQTLDFRLMPKAPVDKTVKGIKIWVDGTNEDFTQDLIEPIQIGVPYTKQVSYDIGKYGAPKQVIFTPIIDVNGQDQPCPDGAAMYTQ